MRKRFKIVLNLDIENPDDPFPACGDFTHLNKMQGIIYEIMSYAQFYWRNQVKYSVTLDKVIEAMSNK